MICVSFDISIVVPERFLRAITNGKRLRFLVRDRNSKSRFRIFSWHRESFQEFLPFHSFILCAIALTDSQFDPPLFRGRPCRRLFGPKRHTFGSVESGTSWTGVSKPRRFSARSHNQSSSDDTYRLQDHSGFSSTITTSLFAVIRWVAGNPQCPVLPGSPRKIEGPDDKLIRAPSHAYCVLTADIQRRHLKRVHQKDNVKILHK